MKLHKVALPTVPRFLRSHFKATRRYLTGLQPTIISPKPEVVLFSQSEKSTPVVAVAKVEPKAKPSIKPVVTPAKKAIELSKLELPKVALPEIKLPQLKTREIPQLKLPPISRRALQHLLTAIIISSILAAVVVVGPSLYYRVAPVVLKQLQSAQSGTPLGGAFEQGTQPAASPQPAYQPPVDPSLPTGTWLVIPRIGVRTEMKPDQSVDEALQKGVWMVPGYGEPGDKTKPMILAAHRYGWKWWWQSDYWKYNSFYYLPDLEPGDQVEVIADQRKWVYEIYAGAEGDEITDYHADLILYTCKFLNSPVRHFRYARLIDPTKNTQAEELPRVKEPTVAPVTLPEGT